MADWGDAAQTARRALAALGCTRAEALALAVLGCGALAALAVVWWAARPDPAALPAQPESPEKLADDATSAPAVSPQSEPVTVHVTGEVAEPGLVQVPGGARVADAIDAAGGPTGQASLEAVNLARTVQDGEQLHVHSVDAVEEAAARGATGPDGTVNVNRADAAELEQVPGIGPVLAERIIAYRDANGPFVDLSELLEVSGIGERTLEQLSDHLTT